MRFDGFQADGDEANELSKTFGVMLFCIAGNATEVVQGEYAFLASLRIHLQGSREVVVTSAPAMVNWASLHGRGGSDSVTLAQAQNKFKQLGAKEMESFLFDPSHWVEHGVLEQGDMMYLPVGSLAASRTKERHAVGLKVGLVAPTDASAAQCLDNAGNCRRSGTRTR